MPEEEKGGRPRSIAAQSRQAVTLRSFQDVNAGVSDFFWSAMDWLFGIDSSAAAAAHEDEEKRAANRVEALSLLDRDPNSELGRAGAIRPYTSFPQAIRDRQSSARQPLLRASPPPDDEDNEGSETAHEGSVMSRKGLPPGARYARPKDAPLEYSSKSDDDSPPHSLNSRPPYHPHDGVPAPGSRIVESFLTVPGAPQRGPQADSHSDRERRVSSSSTLSGPPPASPAMRPSTSSSMSDTGYFTPDERPNTSETLAAPERGGSARRSSGSSSTDSPTLGELYLGGGNNHHYPQQRRPLPQAPVPQHLAYYANPLQNVSFPPSFPVSHGPLPPVPPQYQQQPQHQIPNPPPLAFPPRSSSGTYATRPTMQPPEQQHWGSPSSASEVLTFVRMSDGKLVRKLSTIASESEPATSVVGGGGGSVRSSSLSSTSFLGHKYGSASSRSQL
jgi:hypothetical protein